MDKYKLEYEIKSSGHSIEEYCAAVGFSKSAYYRRIKGEVEFTRDEMQKTVDFLGLESPMDIFFTNKVS